jgi:hypothetical protein
VPSGDEGFGELLRSPLEDLPPTRPHGRLLAILALILVVAGAGIGITVLSLRGRADDEATPASGSTSSTMAGTTIPGTTIPGTTMGSTTTATAEPVLILDTPAIYAPVSGPEPAAAPSSSGAAFALEPIEAVSLDERGFLENLDHLTSSSQSGGEFPDPTRTAVGEIPGTSYRLFEVRGVNGFSNDPDAGKPGECYYLFGIRELPSQASADCFTSPDSPTVTPLWGGMESLGVYAWADLPPEASVAVLMVDGSAEMWQQPQSGVVAFSLASASGNVSLVVLDASGAEIARGDRTPRIPPPTGPITGYGDFTGLSPDDINWEEAWASVARCMTEQGYDTIGFAAGLFYLEIPGTEDPVNAVAEACLEGMSLPPEITRADG